MHLELDDKDMMVIRYLLFYKRNIVFEIIFWIPGTRNQVPDRIFPWKLLPSQRNIEQILISDRRNYLKLDQR